MDNSCTSNHVFVTLGLFQQSVLHNWIYVNHVDFDTFGLKFSDESIDTLKTMLANQFKLKNTDNIYYYIETFAPHLESCPREKVLRTGGFNRKDIFNYVMEEGLYDHYCSLAKTMKIEVNRTTKTEMAKVHTFSANSPEAFERYMIDSNGKSAFEIKTYDISLGVTRFLKDTLKFYKSMAVFKESTNDNK